jgi:hypothetical protein
MASKPASSQLHHNDFYMPHFEPKIMHHSMNTLPHFLYFFFFDTEIPASVRIGSRFTADFSSLRLSFLQQKSREVLYYTRMDTKNFTNTPRVAK